MKIDFDNYLKFPPTSFCQLVRWLCHNTIRIVVTFMQLEVHLLHIGRHLLVVVRLDVHGPLMCVSILLSFLTKVTGYISVNYRLDYGNPL